MRNEPEYKRVLLKISGEALRHDHPDRILDDDFTAQVADAIGQCVRAGVEVAVVIGAGNIWRGARQGSGMDRCIADNMGMLATAINSLGMQDALIRAGVSAKVLSAVDMPKIAEIFTRERALSYMKQGNVVLLACGSGNPFFSTDTAAMLRSAELSCDALMMAKNIDGIYNKDPNKPGNEDAVRYETLTYRQILSESLKAIDAAAAALGQETGQRMLVFDANDPASIADVILGRKAPGTIVYGGN